MASLMAITNPNGGFITALSIFPLTAPVAMMTRVAAVEVPLEQLLISMFLMAITTVVILLGAARLYRAQTLLSGQPFSFRRMFDALRG
jgi:ABC-2 type transport system permease protein